LSNAESYFQLFPEPRFKSGQRIEV